MSTARIARGRRTQRVLAAYLAAHGWPHATSKGAFEGGRDIEGMPGLSVECKATSDGSLTGALRQAEAYAAGDLPLVVWRPNGYGEERIGDWVVAMRLDVATRLLRDAGYGEPIETEELQIGTKPSEEAS